VDLVWIQGPYPAGAFNNVKIFKKVFWHFLEPGKCVKADNQPRRSSAQISPATPSPMRGCSPASVLVTFTTWGILSQVYRHNIACHGKVFRAIAIITQLAIKNGRLLFPVDYKD
jgi:hypothetical protein